MERMILSDIAWSNATCTASCHFYVTAQSTCLSEERYKCYRLSKTSNLRLTYLVRSFMRTHRKPSKLATYLYVWASQQERTAIVNDICTFSCFFINTSEIFNSQFDLFLFPSKIHPQSINKLLSSATICMRKLRVPE